VTSLTVEPAIRGLRGRLRVPGDKSISHRALLLAARADGRSEITGLSAGEDVVHTGLAVGAFGAGVDRSGDRTVVVHGGTDRLREPVGVIDVGNSGTAIRLLAGWASALRGLTVLQGDDSIARRPMGRVADPLRQMGAHIDGREDGRFPPLVIRGGALTGIDYQLPVPSAQVKGSLLLAALGAEGPTTVREAVPTRRHTEELLAAFGVRVDVDEHGSGSSAVTVHPGPVQPFRLDVPCDPSQAAFWVVAGCLVPGSDLVVEHVYVGPGRAGFLDVLRRMGADLTLEEEDPLTRTADIHVRAGALVATEVGGPEVPSLIDEIPVLAVAAAAAEGTTTFSDAAELAVKETDRIATTVSELTAVGVHVVARSDGLVVEGRAGRPFMGGSVESHGDHRIAMALAVAGLAASDPVLVSGWDAVATSYPSFKEDLRRCVS
jgi:3-phosphoshikimate 1-carboxyvinyltransferase